jgi:hypothetical protein
VVWTVNKVRKSAVDAEWLRTAAVWAKTRECGIGIGRHRAVERLCTGTHRAEMERRVGSGGGHEVVQAAFSEESWA